MNDPYYGDGLKDQNGKPLNLGDKVRFLGDEHTLVLKEWKAQDGNKVKRVEIEGASYWLTPDTAKKCIKVLI